MSLLNAVNYATGYKKKEEDNSFSTNNSGDNNLLQSVQIARGEIKPTLSQQSKSIFTPSQPQNQSFFQKVGNFIGNTIPETLHSIGDVIKDPFNTKADPKKAVGDLLKTPVEAYQEIGKNVTNLKSDLKNKNTPFSQTAGDVLKTVASQGNFVVSPISAFFNAANDVPAIGTLSKLLTTPFTAIGEATPKATNATIDAIPDKVMSQRAKDNLKPGIGEIVSLAAQLVAGHAIDVGGKKVIEKSLTIAKEKIMSLQERFGKEDAQTIHDQAIKLAEEKITKEAETPVNPGIQSLENNISEYKRFGGFTEGTQAPDAAVRDMSALIDKPEIIQYTQSKLQSNITAGTIKTNPDGTITLYRGGEPSPKNDLISYSYKKDIAQSFVDEATRKGQQIPLTEIKVKPEDVKVFIGGSEGEVMLKKDAKVEKVESPAIQEKIDKFNAMQEENKPQKQLAAPEAPKQLSAPKDQYVTGAGFEMTDKADPVKAKMMQAINTYRSRVESFNKNPTPKRLKNVEVARQSMKRLEQKGLVKETEKQVIKNKSTVAKNTIKEKIVDKPVESNASASSGALEQKVTEQPKEIPIPRDQMPVGQGKEKISRLEERVTEALGKMTPELREKLGLSTYNEMNKKDTIAEASKYVIENPEHIIPILEGRMQAPKGLPTNAIYVAAFNLAKDDSGLARKLTTFSATRAGQEISILTEIDKNSPVSIATQLYKFREAAFRKIHGGKSVDKVIREKVSKIKVKAPQMTDWKALIDQIKC